MEFTDRSDASDEEFEARIAPFENDDARIWNPFTQRYAPRPTSLRPVGSGGRRRDTASEDGTR